MVFSFVPWLIICWLPFWTDRLFDLKVEDKDALLEELQKPWQVQEKTMESDVGILKWVEDLEQRVVSADLHLKVRKWVVLNRRCCSPFFCCCTLNNIYHKTCLF